MMLITATGRITRDAELKYTTTEKAVLSFTLATDVGFGDSKHPVYLGCSLWGKRGESLAPYLLKGVPATVHGNGDLRLWEKGEKHGAEVTISVTEVAIHGSTTASKDSAPAPQGFRDKPPPPPAFGATKADDFADDDIPFN